MIRWIKKTFVRRYLVVQHDHVTRAVYIVGRYWRRSAARGRALIETANHGAEMQWGRQTRYSWEVQTREAV